MTNIMSDNKIQTNKGLCVVALTKYIMKKCNMKQDEAYGKLLQMDLYQLLLDDDSRLFLETNEYLCKCCELELEQGNAVMYEFINQ